MKRLCSPEPGTEEELIRHVLPWVHEAGNPTFDWFFGGRDNACRVLSRRLATPASEFSLGRMKLLFEGDLPTGGYIALPPEELKRRRRADVLNTLRELKPDLRSDFLRRVAEIAALQLPSQPGESYLSVIGVHPRFRGGGRGRLLVEDFLENGHEQGVQRFRLEVRADNAPAIRLYELHGFSTVHEATSAEMGLTLLTMGRDGP